MTLMCVGYDQIMTARKHDWNGTREDLSRDVLSTKKETSVRNELAV